MNNETKKSVIYIDIDKTSSKSATHTISKLAIKGVVYKLPITIEIDKSFKVNYPGSILNKLFEHYGYSRELAKKYGDEYSKGAVTTVCFFNGYYIPMKVRPILYKDADAKMYTELLELMAKEYKWPVVKEEKDSEQRH